MERRFTGEACALTGAEGGLEATKLKCTPCTDATDDILLDDPVQQGMLPVNADPVVLLARERAMDFR